MEFANHFAKNHALVLSYTTTFRCQVRITVDVSNFEISKMTDSSDVNDEI